MNNYVVHVSNQYTQEKGAKIKERESQKYMLLTSWIEIFCRGPN